MMVWTASCVDLLYATRLCLLLGRVGDEEGYRGGSISVVSSIRLGDGAGRQAGVWGGSGLLPDQANSSDLVHVRADLYRTV
jgi:hypothetical protein